MDSITVKLEHDGRPVECEVEYTTADHGIGGYEFWGAPGCDCQIGIDDFTIISAQWLDSGVPVLTQQQIIDIAESHEDMFLAECEKHFQANRHSEPEPPYGE